MRYEDWDILLFPRDCKVPVKEFKVACHVVHDAEFSHSQGSFGLPTVCCFVPSLAAGTPFQISVHSWSAPVISQFTRCYSKYAENVTFEARLFIDGRLVASTSLDRKSGWPHVIAHIFEFSKNGDLEPLRFPTFRQELLQQNYWSPADDLGRIKIVISEGFPRDSLSMPIERVKNIVAFSFQHAPLEILEASSIAWPNPSMWRRTPFTASMPVPTYPSDDADSHAHSPRRRVSAATSSSSGYSMHTLQEVTSINTPASNGTMKSGHQGHIGLSITGNNGTLDPFGDTNAYFEWLSGMGMGMGDAVTNITHSHRKSSTDAGMRDCMSIGHEMEPTAVMDQQFTVPGFRHEEDSHFGYLKVPTNTPTAGAMSGCEAEGIPFPLQTQGASFSTDMTNSLLNQPMPAHMLAHNSMAEIRSRKENRLQQPADPSPSTISSTSTCYKEQCDMRRVSHQMYTASGANVPVGKAASQANSPQSQVCSDMSQRVSTIGDFVTSLGTGSAGETMALMTPATSSMEKGTKRSRNFTSASAGTIDEEDEPRRVSPRVHLSPFVGGSPSVETQ